MELHEVVENYGPIVAARERDVFVTANGAYLNVWVGVDYGPPGMSYTNIEAYDIASRLDLDSDVSPFDPLANVPIWRVVDAARELLAEVMPS